MKRQERSNVYFALFQKIFLIGNCISDKGANFALKSNIIMDTNDSEERIPTHRELWNKCKKLL